MRLVRPKIAVVGFILPAALSASTQLPFPQASEPEEVAPGVFVFPSDNATTNIPDGNSTYIIGSNAVLVVDAPSMRLTRQHLAWLRQKTSVPVRYLVNTHAHLDHTSGNQILADAFPDLRILATEFAKRIGDRRNPSVIARARAGESDSTVAGLKRLIASGRDEEGKELTPYQLARMRRTVDQLEPQLADRHERRYVGPTDIVESDRRIDLGGRTVLLRRYPGHTLGDLVAIVQGAGVVITGDLVVVPVPYGTGQTVFRDWSASLAALEKLPGIKVIIPGHGSVLHSWNYVRLEREAIDSLTSQMNAAVLAGLTFDQAKARINMSRFRELIAGSDPDRQWAFDNYFLGLRRAFDEASGFVN